MSTTYWKSAGQHDMGPSWSGDVSDAISTGLEIKMSSGTTLSEATSYLNNHGDVFQGGVVPLDPMVRISMYPTDPTAPPTEKQPFPSGSSDIGNINSSTNQMQMWNFANPFVNQLPQMANVYGPSASGLVNSPNTMVVLEPNSTNNKTTAIPHANYTPSWLSARKTFQTPGSSGCVTTIKDQNSSNPVTYVATPFDQCVCRCQAFASSHQLSPVDKQNCMGYCKDASWSNGGPPITDLQMPQKQTDGTFACVVVDPTTYDSSNAPPAMTAEGCQAYINDLNNTTPGGSCQNDVCYVVENGACVKTTDPNCISNNGFCTLAQCCSANNFTSGACANPTSDPGSISLVEIVSVGVIILVIFLFVRKFLKK